MVKIKIGVYLIALSLFLLTAQGCVTRALNVETSPSNASVYIDDKYAGESPVSVPFTHYGTRKITIEKKDEDGRLILKRKINYEKIKAPLYEKFPLDFFSEIILPVKLEDIHSFSYQLEDLEEIPLEEQKKQILINAQKLRRKALDL